MDFHVITPRGSILLFSVDSGRIVPTGPDSSEPLASSCTRTVPIAPPRTQLKDHAADDIEIHSSLM